jgi:rubrerythrin
MSIVSKISGAVGGASKSVSDKTKNLSDASNLKNKILYEEERIVEIFTEIGQKYYKDRTSDTSKLDSLCEDIDTRRRRIMKMRVEYNQIKGYKVCPKCGTKLTDKFQFCGKCGAKLPDMDDENFSKLNIEGFYDEDNQ